MRLTSSMIAVLVLHCLAGDAAAQSSGAARSGTIRVLSNAARAVVSLDGTDVGVAPVEIKQVRPGEHVVAVRAEGRGRREDRVTVEAGATAVVTLDLDEPAGGGQEGGDAAGADDDGDAGLDPGPGGGPGASASDGGGAAGRDADDGGGAIAAAAPTEEELLLERRGLTTFGARALPRGRSTVAIGAGYPYLIDSRILVGAMPRGAPFELDAGILFRTYGQRWELGLLGRLTLFDQEPFSLGAFADLGGGSTYFDDSRRNYWFASGGVAASLSGLGAVTITGRAYLDAWSDRHCPGEVNEGEPTDVCQDFRDSTLSPDERARVIDLVGSGNLFDRDSGVRGILSLAVELALSETWSGWLLIEGAPRQDERAAFTDLFHGAMFEEDARTYARVGFTYKF
jgi:hypothetical protein